MTKIGEMSHEERVMATIMGEEPDLVPIASNEWLPKEFDTPEFYLSTWKDINRAVRMLEWMHERFNFDIMTYPAVRFSAIAEALGFKLYYNEEFFPIIGNWIWPDSYFIDKEHTVRMARVEDLQKIIESIESVDINREEFAFGIKLANKIRESRIIDCDVCPDVFMDPFSTLSLMIGLNKFPYFLKKYPKEVDELMNKLERKVLFPLARAYVEAGVKNFYVGLDLVLNSIADEKLREEWWNRTTKYLRRIVDGLKKLEEVVLTSHICLNSTYLLNRCKEVADMGMIIIWIADPIDVAVRKRLVPGAVMRGMHGVRHMLYGTPELIERVVKYCVGRAAAGGGYIVGVDEVIPSDTPIENVEAYVKAARKWGKYPIPEVLQLYSPYDL